jgi:signal transduction histidine kinase
MRNNNRMRNNDMTFNSPQTLRASSCTPKSQPVTWTLVQNFIPSFGANGKSRQTDRPHAVQGVTVAKFVHEFANELSVVSGLVQFLENEVEQPNQARNTLKHLKSEILRLDSLLNELRSVAQGERLNLQPNELGPLVRELLAVEGSRYTDSGIRVEIDLPPDLPRVRLDSSKFRQALLNLCHNAVDAMPHGGSLILRGSRSNSEVRLDVIDTGEGIPPGLDVFGLFMTTKSNGMGVGLSIVREIILRHGGTVTYTSEPGVGTTFRLALPACE